MLVLSAHGSPWIQTCAADVSCPGQCCQRRTHWIRTPSCTIAWASQEDGGEGPKKGGEQQEGDSRSPQWCQLDCALGWGFKPQF